MLLLLLMLLFLADVAVVNPLQVESKGMGFDVGEGGGGRESEE
jgi:hypothetical protein